MNSAMFSKQSNFPVSSVLQLLKSDTTTDLRSGSYQNNSDTKAQAGSRPTANRRVDGLFSLESAFEIGGSRSASVAEESFGDG